MKSIEAAAEAPAKAIAKATAEAEAQDGGIVAKTADTTTDTLPISKNDGLQRVQATALTGAESVQQD